MIFLDLTVMKEQFIFHAQFYTYTNELPLTHCGLVIL